MKRSISSRKSLSIVKHTLRNLSEQEGQAVQGGRYNICTLMRTVCSSMFHTQPTKPVCRYK